MKHPLHLGLACTLGAGLLWGMVFIAPVLLPGYSPLYLSASRYLAFGLVTLLLAGFDWRQLRALDRSDWWAALELSLIGNLLYYAFLASAIQVAGAPLPTMIIGALPVVISICANLHQASLPWRRLLLPLGLIALGIAAVHRDEWQHLQASLQLASTAEAGRAAGRFLWGGLLALGAVACWTWYPIRNSRWLQRRPHIQSTTWANAQGLATLPLALLAIAALLMAQFGGAPLRWITPSWRPFGADLADEGILTLLLGPQPLLFLALMLALGLGASWLGTLLWNRASQLLPASLTGQLIVFETLSAMGYAFIQRGQWPGGLTALGMGLLVAGVVMGVRAFRLEPQMHAA